MLPVGSIPIHFRFPSPGREIFMNAPAAVPAHPQTRPRWHLFLASAVVLLFAAGMGFFLDWVSRTPRTAKLTPSEEENASAPKPPRKDTDRLTDIAAIDFGEVAPLAVFPALELPAP